MYKNMIAQQMGCLNVFSLNEVFFFFLFVLHKT